MKLIVNCSPRGLCTTIEACPPSIRRMPAGQVPTVDLLPGARVRIVATPRAQEDVPTSIGTGTPAVLISTSTDEVSGNTIANVAVPAPQAAALAALAATGRAALVLDADEAR